MLRGSRQCDQSLPCAPEVASRLIHTSGIVLVKDYNTNTAEQQESVGDRAFGETLLHIEDRMKTVCNS